MQAGVFSYTEERLIKCINKDLKIKNLFKINIINEYKIKHFYNFVSQKKKYKFDKNSTNNKLLISS